MQHRLSPRLLTVSALAALTLLLTAAAPLGYHIVKNVKLTSPNGYYDYIVRDVPNNRLYVSNGNQVHVLNLTTQAVVGRIGGFGRMHGIAISDKDGHGFITDDSTKSVVEFDIHTLKKIKSIPAAEDVDGIIYDPATDRVFAFCGDAHKAFAINAETGAVDKDMDLGGKPEYAVSDRQGHVFNVLADINYLLDIDSKNLTIVHRYPLAPCGDPTGVDMDRQHRRIVIGCRSGIMIVVNADNGKIVYQHKIGALADAARFDPKTQLAFVSVGQGMIHVFHEDAPDSYTYKGAIQTENGMRTMEIDPRDGTLFTDGSKLQGPPIEKIGQKPGAPIPNTFHLLVIKN